MKTTRFLLLVVSLLAIGKVSFAQVVVGPNVDIMLNDPYNQKQVEVAAAVNPLSTGHMFAGYIDYQTIANEDPAKPPTSRGVCAFSFSTNGGKTWRNGLVPSPPNREKCGDPAVAWDTNRHVFYFGLIERPDGIREMTVWRFTDLDDGSGSLSYDFMVLVATGTPGAELDKNSLIFQPDASSPDPSAPGTLYACYASFQGGAQNNIKVLCSISRDRGASWSLPNQGKYNGNLNSNNGTAAAPGPGGSIYLFWRAFSASENGIYMVKVSPDGNATSPTMVVGGAGFYPMDMPTRVDLARSNAFPVVSSNGLNEIFLTFQAYSGADGRMAAPSVLNTSRIFGTYTTDGGAHWSQPRALDYGPHSNTVQFMPSTIHSGGVYSVIYYDGRNDGCVTQAGMAGSELGTGNCGVGRPNNLVAEGYFPTGKDRRFELRVVQGTFDASGQLNFASPSTQVTQYDTQSSDAPLPHPLVSRNANCAGGNCPPGLSYNFLTVGAGGTRAWMGDYIAHIAQVPLVRNLPTAAVPNPAAWRHSRPGDPSTDLAFWIDFSKVAFPLTNGQPDINGDWTQFVPAGFLPQCVNPKTRDVRVLFAEITNRGLSVTAKATSRRAVAGATAIPPEFAVNVQNLTGDTIFVRLNILDTPAEDWSLVQTLPAQAADPPDSNVVDLRIMRNSSVTQTIFYRWRGSTTFPPIVPAMVSVQQLTGRLLDDSADCPFPAVIPSETVRAPVCVAGGSVVSNGLSASVIYNLSSSTLPVTTAHGVNVSTPVVTSFSSGSDQPSNTRIDNTRIDNTRIDNTRIDNTRIDNTRIDNTRIDNTRIDNTRIDNSLVPDQQVIWTVTGAGSLATATTAFTQVANGPELLAAGWAFQVVITQTQLNPNVFVDSARNCTLTSTATDVVLSNFVITTPNGYYNTRLDNTRLDNFQVSSTRIDNTRLDNTAIQDNPISEQISNAAVALDTFEEATVILRAFKPTDTLLTLALGCTGDNGNCPNTNQIAETISGQAADPVTGARVVAYFDTTPPVITANVSGTLGSNGWYRSNVAVTWTVQDPQSGIASTTGCDPVTLSSETDGVSLTCSATNGKGLSGFASITIKIDKTPPTASASASPAANANGWNNTDVTVTFSGTDARSGIDSCSAAALLSSEGAGQSASGTCTDLAGNVSPAATVANIKIDKTAPTIAGSRSPGANANGWNNTDVTVSFACSDSLSGLAAGSPPANTVLSSEGANQSVGGTCADRAGNSSSATVSGIKIDKTAPTIIITTPAPEGTYFLNATVPSNYGCSDALSGVATCSGPVPTGSNFSTSTLGANPFTVSATDMAGNPAVKTNSYFVVYYFALTPLKSPANAGSAVPLTWQLRDQGANGAIISDLGSLVTLTTYYTGMPVSGACTLDTPGAGVRIYNPASGATGGSDFRFIQSSSFYRFNWASATVAGCYTIVWQLKDNSGPAPAFAVLNPNLLKKTSIQLK